MRIEDIIDKEIYVKCSSKEEYLSFLKAAEKAGMKWATGKRPTQPYEDYWINKPIYLYCYKDAKGNNLRYDNGNYQKYVVVKFSDLDLSRN